MMKTENMPIELTVIIRDESPLYIEEPCTYRRVTIKLTDEQRSALELKSFGHQNREQISRCLLEFPATPQTAKEGE